MIERGLYWPLFFLTPINEINIIDLSQRNIFLIDLKF